MRDITGRRPDPEKAKLIRTVEELVNFAVEERAAAERGDPEPETVMPV